MALDVATGSFGITTQAAGNTVSVTGLSFQPKVVIFAWNGRTAAGQGEADHMFGMGYMVGASDRGGFANFSDHGVTTSDTSSQVFDDACIKTQLAASLDGAADFDAWLSDGFRLIIDDAFPSNYLITYLALGGNDLASVASATLTFNATGDTDVTSIGFQPDCAMLFGARDNILNAVTVSCNGCFGVAAGSSPTNYLVAGFSLDIQPTSVTRSYCKSGEILAQVASASTLGRGSISSWLSNGFRFNCTETPSGDINARVLCLQGGQYFAGDILSQTGTSNTAETGVGFTPKALILASHNKAQSDADTPQNHDERCVGFAVSSTERNAVGIMDKDSANTMDIGIALHTDQCYSNQSTASSIAIEGLMDLVSMDADGFTFVMDDADPAQAFVWYLAIGNAAANPAFADPPGIVLQAVPRASYW